MFDTLLRSSNAAPDPSEVDDGELVELIVAWERLAGWAAAGQLAAIAELACRRPRDLVDRAGGTSGPAQPEAGAGADAGHPGLPEVSEFAVDEVAAALRLSRPAAGGRLHTAVELTRLPGTAAALRVGDLDVSRVRAVVDAVGVLDTATAVVVEGRVLPRAVQQTVGQLRASLARAVLAVDPAAAEARHERAVAGREVVVRPLRDGMAELWALLPADAAVAVYSRLDHLARAIPAGDARGMDARRADALVCAVLAGSSAHSHAVAAASAAGTGRDAGMSAAAHSGRNAGPAVHIGRGAGMPAVPVGPDAGTSAVRAGREAGTPAAGVSRGAGSKLPALATVHVTVPAETAVGSGEEPGDLAGYGPVPGSLARRLAGLGTWRKVTTDPETGVVLDVGRTAYTPSAAVADLVRARDRTCRFPGCRQPARRCDLDHVVRWPDGPTTADNLAALCRHHHRLKHRTRWTVRAGPGADLEWTSPTGHRYRTSPARSSGPARAG
jgi:hypothetical protein